MEGKHQKITGNFNSFPYLRREFSHSKKANYKVYESLKKPQRPNSEYTIGIPL